MSKPSIMVKTTCTECDGKGYVMVTALASLRKKAGLDQQTVADRLGLTRTSVSNIELGKQAITLDKIAPLAEMYDVDEYEMYQTAKKLLGVTL